MNSVRSSLLLLTFAVLFLSGHRTAFAQSIQVRVLDARSGARVPNEKVSVLIKGEKGALDYTTDGEGNFSLQIDPSAFIWVATEWRVTCRHITQGTDPFVPVMTILQEGFTNENTCGRAKSETVKGKLIIFARKSSFFENFKR
jgi:hypothetical protein